MKKVFKRLIPLVVISLTAVLAPWKISWLWLKPLPDTVQEEVNEAVNYGMEGILVYVDRRGKSPEFYHSGFKNRENKTLTDPQSLFKIGSISKLYIAAATAKLISAQTLDSEEPLSRLLPDLAGRIENADKITLKMLLQHRSGIPDWIDDPDFPWDRSLNNTTDVLNLVLDDPAEFEPDSRYDYSNTNYLLIGNILDKTLGYSHWEYIKKEILNPLGLTHTYGLLSEVNPDDITSGYYIGQQGDVKMLDFVSPGSSVIASAEDVGIFLRALNSGTLLSKDEQIIYSEIYEFEHTGLLPGYQSIARYHKNIDAVVIQFVNTSGGNMWTLSEVVYNRIVKILNRK